MIKVANLSRSFGEFPAVSGVSFEIEKGETFALLGPNGSGKTTVLKMLAGLIRANSGEIEINGHKLASEPLEARRSISYLPQYPGFPDHLVAREVLEFYCSIRKLPVSRIDELLSTSSFDFNGFKERMVGQFSGGMRQRLALAVACLPDAPILLLDEPTSSLDPQRAILFREFLAHLKSKGKTIVFTSHVLPDAEELADRVAILVGGKLVTIQAADELRLRRDALARMSLTLRTMEPRLAEVASLNGASEVQRAGAELIITSLPKDRLRIIKAVLDTGAEISSFTTSEPSIESIYLGYLDGGKERNAASH